MKKHITAEELKRMNKLAGLINEGSDEDYPDFQKNMDMLVPVVVEKAEDDYRADADASQQRKSLLHHCTQIVRINSMRASLKVTIALTTELNNR